MISEIENDSIVEFCLGNPERLELALRVQRADEALRRRIVLEFLEELESRLITTVGRSDWHVVNEHRDDLFRRFMGIYLTKNDWNGCFKIGIEPLSSGAKRFILGVWKDPDRSDDYSTSLNVEKLRGELEQQDFNKGAGPNDHWIWYVHAPEAYQNWTTVETLVRLHRNAAGDEQPLLDRIVDDVDAVRNVAEPYLDQACRLDSRT